jgi:ribonuclease HI
MFGAATKTMQFEIRLDSELVKKQLNAEYQIKEPGLVPMFIEIHNMRVAHFPHLTLTHIPRAQNKEADRLVNEALDALR